MMVWLFAVGFPDTRPDEDVALDVASIGLRCLHRHPAIAAFVSFHIFCAPFRDATTRRIRIYKAVATTTPTPFA